MEYALEVSSLRQLRSFLHNGVMQEVEEITAIVGQLAVTRVYFGQEFCSRLIPSVQQLVGAYSQVKKENLKFTFVTPYLTEQGLERLEILLQELSNLEQAAEVVVNDWGVMYLLTNKFPQLNPIAGRLLGKGWRDPRMPQNPDQGAHDAIFRSCAFFNPFMRTLLDSMSVSRVEIDNPLQDFDPGMARWGYNVSLYVPYGCISSGRICLLGSWGLDKKDKFTAHGKCSKQCRFYQLEMEDTSGQVRHSLEWKIVQRGNTVFYHQTGRLLKKGITDAAKYGINRLVIQA